MFKHLDFLVATLPNGTVHFEKS